MTHLARAAVRWWWAVLLAWAIAVAVAVSIAPPFAEVATYQHIPSGSTAVRGQELLRDGWPEDNFTRSATLILIRDAEPLTDEDRAYADRLGTWIDSPDGPAAIRGVTSSLTDPALAQALSSPDGHAMLVVAGLDSEPFTPEAAAAVEGLREGSQQLSPPAGLDVYVSGSAAVIADEDRTIKESVARTQLLTVGFVVVLLLWIFRSPVAALVPLVTVGTAYVVSLSIVSLLAQAGMDVSYLYETFAIVIVFGAGTDSSLLLLSRYDEELALAQRAGFRAGAGLRRVTLAATLTVLGGVLASSAGTTVVGFSAQSVAEFGLFRTMGPALAVAVTITLIAGLTINPALMRLFGRWLFWPDRYTLPRSSSGTALLLRQKTDAFADLAPEGAP